MNGLTDLELVADHAVPKLLELLVDAVVQA